MSNKKLIEEVTVGCDPEMFLWNVIEDKPVPVCGLVGGTKDNPLPITNEGHALQEDNVAVEFCIPPCINKYDFVRHITFVKNYIDNTILQPLGLISRCVSSARFTEKELDNYQAQTFGCDPDFNAWTEQQNEVDKTDPLLRTAAAHIHIGYQNPTSNTSMAIIQAMDLFIGLPSVLLDTDTERRKMYGKAGEYRLKVYGVEYRVLSTFWTGNDELIQWAFESTLKAIEFVNSGGIITNEQDIIKCINESNKDMALEIMEDYHIEFKELLKIA